MIRIGIVGCEGQLAKEILTEVAKNSELKLESAITYKGSNRVGKELSLISEYTFDNVIISDELLNCSNCDVLIDATNRNAFIEENYKKYLALKKNVVIATTGFSTEDNTKIQELSRYMKVVKAPNYSFELYFFIQAIKEYVKANREIDVAIIEEHHKEKLDMPSGTAIVIKNAIEEANKSLQVDICSVRVGKTSAEHKVLFANSLGEEIRFVHKAVSRNVYAFGIIKIVMRLEKKGVGMYSLEDFI